MKASFNPLLADVTLSTTVPIKVRRSSEMDTICNVLIRVSGTSGFLEAAAGVCIPFKGVHRLDPRAVFGCRPDSSGPSLLAPVGAAPPGPLMIEVPPSGVVFIVPHAA